MDQNYSNKSMNMNSKFNWIGPKIEEEEEEKNTQLR